MMFFVYWFCISALMLLIRYFVLSKYLNRYSYLTSTDVDFNDNFPSLYTINGCGTRFRGEFRKHKAGEYATYQFLCFAFIPVIPIGCYFVSAESNDSYRVFGSVSWRFFEVLAVYLQWYGWAGVIALIVIGSVVLFS